MVPKVNVDANDVEKLIEGCKVIGTSIEGGQKKVFPCIYKGKKLALKFIVLVDCLDPSGKIDKDYVHSVTSRAQRELKVMKDMKSCHFVKLGSIVENIIPFKKQLLFYYSEEWIDGVSVSDFFNDPLKTDIKEVLTLCKHVTKAIDELWSFKMIHRDIKPANIVRRNDGVYVLLDFGIAYDVNGESLTNFGYFIGTPRYASPEHYDYINKSKMDFRADLYCLGMVLYEVLTGKHPFVTAGMDDNEYMPRLINDNYEEPIIVNPNIPVEVNDIICKLLKRWPHQRYRKCQFLLDDIADVESKLGV